MESIRIENLSFTYPGKTVKAIDNISFTVKQGEFLTICGRSGCGKTTLLRLLKPSVSPYGETIGNVIFEGEEIRKLDARKEASKIGFVFQSPDNQIVTDKVWHELAFGLESLGFKTSEIRARVSEMASFFGIQTWFHKKVTELSGGQKQLLNLASIMVMQPSVLILDEPTGQLDPIAAHEFINTLARINRELGTTIILTEHRLEETFFVSDRIIVMDNATIIADGTPSQVGAILNGKNHEMKEALPAPMRIFAALDGEGEYPVSIRDGRRFLEEFSKNKTVSKEFLSARKENTLPNEKIIEVKDVWFRYEKTSPDVIKNLNFSVKKGELFAILGGNGTGKTTALSLLSGINTPYRGKILINGEPALQKNLYSGVMGVLPQNPQTVFVKKTVYEDLLEILSDTPLSQTEKEAEVKKMAAICHVTRLMESHPYDLSGGEQQRAALCKVLLKKPDILLLDEPTKGLDAAFKRLFKDILKQLCENGMTVIMVSHDIEFCAEFADRCAMFFDGGIVSEGTPREFFAGKSFYTTAANTMARNIIPEAILSEDIILAFGGKLPERKKEKLMDDFYKEDDTETKASPKKPERKILQGISFALLFVITCIMQIMDVKLFGEKVSENVIFQIFTILFLAVSFVCFFPPQKKAVIMQAKNKKFSKRSLMASLFVLIAVPFTIYFGIKYLNDRKYLFISLLIILEVLVPFAMVFESRRPKARELIIISVLCAIAVAGRVAFYMLPQFKPVLSLVIIAGMCFGAEAGFLCGAITGLVSNFFFGQGPWTPWQMFSFGITGFLAGILFNILIKKKSKLSVCIFGAFSAIFIYGGIMNPASVIMAQENPTLEMILASYFTGFPLDAVHAVSTFFFLWFIYEPMTEKLERIKVKYGLIER